MDAGPQLESRRESRGRRPPTVVKLIHGRKIIRVKPIGIFPRLTKRRENPLFEGALSVVLCNMRFDSHDAYPLPRSRPIYRIATGSKPEAHCANRQVRS